MLSIGIDLGTTNSVASYLHGDVPRTIANRQGEVLTPSVVSIRRGQRPEFLVGRDALQYAAQAPVDTVYSVKRLMGLNVDDENVQKTARRVPYAIRAPADGADIGARVVMNDRMFTPIEVSARILERIKEIAQQRLGQRVDAATITVPAYFLDNQKNATKDAGEMAGLRLHPLLDEPIAAALSFGYDRGEKERLLVYDLGGGTFDVSIIQMAGDNLQVISKRGDMWFGGDDFDEVIVEAIKRWLNDRYKVDAIDDPSVKHLLKSHAEHAKKVLSQQDQVQILEPTLMSLPSGETAMLDLAVTRRQFESGIKSLVERSLALVDETLDEVSIQPEHLTGVLLVGGSTHVPLVREMLAAKFGEQKLRFDVDPMTCVSLGAALWCKRFPFDDQGRISRQNFAKTGIPIPMDLGVEVYCDGNSHWFEPIIPRNTTYPTPKGAFAKEFYPTSDNQRMVRIPIFQGNAKITALNSFQGLIEQTLPHGIPARTPVLVSFEIDIHGNLSGELEFKGFPELCSQWTIRRNQPLSTDDEQQRLRKWKGEAERFVVVTEGFLERYQSFMTPEEESQFRGVVVSLGKALKDDDRVATQNYIKSLDQAFSGTSIASLLFLASRAQELAGNKNVAMEIARNKVLLENAHKAGNREEVERLQRILRQMVFKVISAQTTTSQSGPLPGQLTPASR
jgi:molecular chaperone DnaK